MVRILIALWSIFLLFGCDQNSSTRIVQDFNSDWYFQLGDYNSPDDFTFETSDWRKLDLPHDWSIEGEFSADHPAGVGGGALPGGIGWYHKMFNLTSDQLDRKAFIEFDGVYQKSTVWINGVKLGHRPNGYISFSYELTPHLKSGPNIIDVRVDNAQQPNSRWYSGSGIYRNVRLITTNKVYIPQWGHQVTTLENQVTSKTKIFNTTVDAISVLVSTAVFDSNKNKVAQNDITVELSATGQIELEQALSVPNYELWTLENPALYTLETTLSESGKPLDNYTTTFGFRSYAFDAENGFSLNGVRTKLKGVCLHHDLGSLGAAFNERAMERQLEIMKGMGVNAIRTSHNPPDPKVLDLCDRMGLLVMDEMFDIWESGKSEFDYSLYWDEWHEKDLRDFVTRDRNHPSIVMWSIGNEIIEQYNHNDSIGGVIAQELAGIVRELDDRPILTANNETSPDNPIIKLGGLDIVGYNYHHEEYLSVPDRFPGKPFVATETNSALATRGHYDLPSDSIRIWPHRWDEVFKDGNPDNTVSAYDHVIAPWGSNHEDTWRVVGNNDFISGMFIWTGFDYLGEPTPYVWPSRSSYFGVVDLAGFPKDTYYFYQSVWSEDTMLHVFPHWTATSADLTGWEQGQLVDVWAYYNNADEAELFLNGKSLGVKSKGDDSYHVMWRVPFETGELKAVSRKDGEVVMTKQIVSAGEPAKISLIADRNILKADGYDLAFVTVEVLDTNGNIVPNANNEISFDVSGSGKLKAVDNGDPVSHQSFLSNEMKAFHGKCLAIIQADKQQGTIKLSASAEGLEGMIIELRTKDN